MLLIFISPAIGFYLAGVAPTNNAAHQKVDLLVNALSSPHHSLIPYDYYSPEFHFCQPEQIISQSESLGSILFGDRLFSSAFELKMLENTTCNLLCVSTIPPEDAKTINQRIKQGYLTQWMIDGLPVSQKSDLRFTIPGFQLGQVQGETVLLNNHYEIYIQYHQRGDSFRVVGASVNPSSLKSDICVNPDQEVELSETKETKFPYTYDVYWVPSDIPWGSRWDHYLNAGDDKVHWFSIINALIVMILLAAIVFGILLRALKRDIIRYNDIEIEDVAEEVGWKLVHGDVFRPPVHRMWLSMLVGNGMQMIGMTILTLAVACLGFLSPSNRGSLATMILISYVVLSTVAGYFSARVYKMCGGAKWKQNVFWTTFLIPGSLLIFLLVINFVFIAQKSSSAIPFGTLFALFSLWFFLSIPLGLVGAYYGFKKEVN